MRHDPADPTGPVNYGEAPPMANPYDAGWWDRFLPWLALVGLVLAVAIFSWPYALLLAYGIAAVALIGMIGRFTGSSVVTLLAGVVAVAILFLLIGVVFQTIR